MTLFRTWVVLASASTVVLLAGCGKKASSEAGQSHSEHEEGEGGGGGVSFKEGRGLAFKPEVLKALDVKTAEVEERPLADNIRLIAQVFEISPQILASATVPVTDAEHFEKHPFKGAKLIRVDRSTASATRLVDLVIALERTTPPAMGEFVEVVFAAEPSNVLTVPLSALLDSATGTFVYVVNGENYWRTAVKTGARSTDFVEITDGLYAGDVVVTTPVEQLWLSELRLTKGGGHSH